jgi:hypothetical protein
MARFRRAHAPAPATAPKPAPRNWRPAKTGASSSAREEQFRRRRGPGPGLHPKLTNNLISSNRMQPFTGGLTGGTKAGVDPDLVLDILNHKAARTG